MKKIALFVEGRTEQLLTCRLLDEVAGSKRICIDRRKAYFGGSRPRTLEQIEAHSLDSSAKYFALVVDCGNDSRVRSDIDEQYESLCSSGYSAIVGIRDAYPLTPSQVPSLRTGLRYRLKTKPINPVFALGVMEVEAWFLAEHTHFQRVVPPVPHSQVVSTLGFDPATDDVTQRPHPAGDLHLAYQSVGGSYAKGSADVVAALDLARFYVDLPSRIGDLKVLVETLDVFFT